MVLSTSEMKVQNEVPVPEPARILDILWQVKQHNKENNKIYTNIQTMLYAFYEPAELFIC